MLLVGCRIMPAPVPIEVTENQQRELERIVKAKTSRQRDVFRARIILGLAQGLSHEEIAGKQSVSLLAIGRWRKRWAAKGLEGLRDAPGRGRKARLSVKAVGRPLSLGRTALESGAHASSARRSLERAHDGPPNRAEQIERAATLVGPSVETPPGAS